MGNLANWLSGNWLLLNEVFGVLVCLCIGLIPYLVAHQLLVFLLWKEGKKKRKEEKKGEKKEERKERRREKGRTVTPEVKVIDLLTNKTLAPM